MQIRQIFQTLNGATTKLGQAACAYISGITFTHVTLITYAYQSAFYVLAVYEILKCITYFKETRIVSCVAIIALVEEDKVLDACNIIIILDINRLQYK